MAGTAHIEHGVIRWPGKPTSGRYVFRSYHRDGWFWQCELHEDEPASSDYYGEIVPTMQESFAGALAHAAVCKPSIGC